jgi:branched-chain amino acid aminotransferase
VLIHLNGRLVPEDEGVVSVFDRGFLFGDGVFESMRSYAGRVFRLAPHLDRLGRSAALAGLPGSPSRDHLEAAVGDLLQANGLADARLRLTLTRGPGRPGDYVGADGPPTVVISASPYAGPAAALVEEGVPVTVAARRAVPADCLDPAIKSLSRMASVLARREADAKGAFETILLDAAGRLTEGTSSNVFLVAGGRLLTPAAPRGALPGVTRAAVLEAAAAAGIAAQETDLPAERLAAAEEVFLTNSSWEVLPVSRVDGRPVGRGRPGTVTRELLARYRALVRRECGCG